MRSSRFAISKSGALDAGSISWLLAQTFWVGGMAVLQFLLLPAVGKVGLAPLLMEEIMARLNPLMVGLAAVCAGLQVVVLVRVQQWAALWRDMRGQLLLTVLLMAASYLLVTQWAGDAQRWLRFSYLVMLFCGLLLILQPLPRAVTAKPQV